MKVPGLPVQVNDDVRVYDKPNYVVRHFLFENRLKPGRAKWKITILSALYGSVHGIAKGLTKACIIPLLQFVETTFGLLIQWDRFFSVRITLTPEHSGKVCGMCGDYDENPDNDWIIGPNNHLCSFELHSNRTVGQKVSGSSQNYLLNIYLHGIFTKH